MRHLRTRTTTGLPGVRYVTDPATGRTYALPAGGAGDDDGGDDDGGSDDDQDDQDDDGADDDDGGSDDDQDDQDDELGDKGKKALDRMKEKERATRRELRAYKKLGLTPEQISQLAQKAQGDDDEPDVDAIRQQVRTEVQTEVMRDRALDKVEAKAAKRFANPEVARALLADRADDFVDGENIDVDEITEALDELLENEPYLAAQGGKWKGGGDGGARPSKPERPKSIAEAIANRQKS